MAPPLHLWTTPSLQLSVLIEAEHNELFRVIYGLIRSNLRDLVEHEDVDVISSATLRTVDYDMHALGDEPSYEELASRSNLEGNEVLKEAYKRVQRSHDIATRIKDRTRLPVSEDAQLRTKLLDIWKLYNTDESHIMSDPFNSRLWVNLGFQGASPLSDLRSLGPLALDTLDYFGKNYTDDAVRIVDESVNGGEYWYPFALALMHITSFVLALAEGRKLQLVLLRHLQFEPENEDEVFFDVCSQLMIQFHTFWVNKKATVMDFESTFASFKQLTTPYIERGILDYTNHISTPWLNSEGRIKLD